MKRSDTRSPVIAGFGQVAGLLACLSMLAAAPRATADDVVSTSVDSVSNCLLPPKVQKLRSGFLYLAPQRVERLAAERCVRSGGIIVASAPKEVQS